MNTITVGKETLHLKAEMVEKWKKGEILCSTPKVTFKSDYPFLLLLVRNACPQDSETIDPGWDYIASDPSDRSSFDQLRIDRGLPSYPISDFFTHPEEESSPEGYKEAFEKMYEACQLIVDEAEYADLDFPSMPKIRAALTAAQPFINQNKE